MTPDRTPDRALGRLLRTRRPAPRVLAGALAALLVLVAGAVFALLIPAEYRATSTLVVLPTSSAQTPEYYDTLSQGQVSQTFAQVLQLGAAQITKSADGAATASVVAVPNTALITISATAGDRQAAEDTADAVLDRSSPYVQQLRSPYRVVVVRDAQGTASASGIPRWQLAVVVPVVALVCAIAVHQAVRSLRRDPRSDAVRADDHVTGAAGRPVAGPLPQPAR